MPGNTKPQTSFIPQDAGNETRTRRAGTSGLLDLFTLVAAVLFVASAALGAGMFLYQQFLQSNSASKLSQLNKVKEAFEPQLIRELSRLDDRMRVGSDLLGRHLAASAFFRMLEATTVTAVTFRSLDMEAADPQRMTIRMDGVAESMNSIALQADLFSKVGMVTSPIFSNIDRRADGVHFSFTAILNPAALNYTSLVRGIPQITGGEQLPPSPASQEPASPFDAPPSESADGSPETGE